jgi:hypothetical protein
MQYLAAQLPRRSRALRTKDAGIAYHVTIDLVPLGIQGDDHDLIGGQLGVALTRQRPGDPSALDRSQYA